jgi:hypothetical protein
VVGRSDAKAIRDPWSSSDPCSNESLTPQHFGIGKFCSHSHERNCDAPPKKDEKWQYARIAQRRRSKTNQPAGHLGQRR